MGSVYYEHEAYLMCEGKVVRYLPLPRIGDEYGLKIRCKQTHFDFFDNLLSTNGPIHFEVDYLVTGGASMDDLIDGSKTAVGGTLNLQLKDSKEYDGWVIYEVYIHTLECKENTTEDIIKSINRMEKIESILL